MEPMTSQILPGDTASGVESPQRPTIGARIALRVRASVSRPVIYLLQHAVLSRRTHAAIGGIRMTIEPGVFHPNFFHTSKLMARYVAAMHPEGKRILDMGTGSGILALHAAAGGGLVTAVDISPAALACAKSNAQLNGLGDNIVFLQSDLFDSISRSSRFDAILWNPPFYPSEPVNDADRAWKAGTSYRVIDRFASTVRPFLSPGGTVTLILSAFVDVPMILSMFRGQGFTYLCVQTRRRIAEQFFIYEFTPQD
jgi:release factor glutamine methyltransferase